MRVKVLIVVLAALVAVPFVEAADTHLFILSGQSNMARFDPNVSFTPAMVEKFGKENVTVVKSAQGGQPIRRWYKEWKDAKGEKPAKTGDLYDLLMKGVNQASAKKKFTTVTFIWMQGERDAREQHGDVYADSLKGLISQLKADLGRQDINIIIGRLSDFDMKNARYKHWTKVREAQVKVAEEDPRSAWVNTDDLNDKEGKGGKGKRNDLHYTPDGYKELGKRYAAKAIELIEKTKGK